jgi:hypothetical protein
MLIEWMLSKRLGESALPEISGLIVPYIGGGKLDWPGQQRQAHPFGHESLFESWSGQGMWAQAVSCEDAIALSSALMVSQ